MTLPGLPFVHARGDGGPRSHTQVVIIHATASTASADAEAAYATHRADETSAHFYVDDNNAVQALRVDHIAWGALWHGNQISVQFELCGRSNHLSDATMRQAAPLVAEVCRRYGIPVRKISPQQVRDGVRGICGHADITAAFPEDHGDHTDPGPSFPWSRFLGYVKHGNDTTQEDDDMATWTSLSCTKTKQMPWNRWHNVDWDVENTDPSHAHANGNAPGFISPRNAYVFVDALVQVRGLSAGDLETNVPPDGYGLRLSNNKWEHGHAVEAWHESLADGLATGGDQYIRVQGSMYLHEGRHMYVQLLPIRRGSPEDAPAPEIVGGTLRIRQDS